eukprot:5524098-Lingulodinium_polyedra.AAC.1
MRPPQREDIQFTISRPVEAPAFSAVLRLRASQSAPSWRTALRVRSTTRSGRAAVSPAAALPLL